MKKVFTFVCIMMAFVLFSCTTVSEDEPSLEEQNVRVHDCMILTIINPLEYDLNYDCFMYDLLAGSWFETGVWPVRAELQASEIWPDIIVSLVLQNFTLSERQ